MRRQSNPRVLLLVLTAFLQTVASPSQSLEEKYGPRLAAFEALARKEMEATHTTGLAIALRIGDEVWARAYGFADVENRAPLKTDASFRLASVTKPMTAVAIVQLADAGKIDLDAEIQTYVPYFPRKNHPVTVRQLLGHLGGIPHYKNFDKELHIKEHKTTREAIDIFKDYDLVAEPGTKYQYSSYGFNLLGAAVEGASGQSYGDYMREHVWAPLGMKDTRMDDPFEIIPNRVRGYDWENGQLRNSEFVDVSSRFAGGGTRSTVLDLLKFAQGFTDGKLVSPARVKEMTTPMRLADGTLTDYGMGWGVDPQNGRYMISHGGAQNETRTFLAIIPGRDAAIAVASNFEAGRLYWFVQTLAAEIFGERWDNTNGSAAYVTNPSERAGFNALRDAYVYGLSAYERDGAAARDAKTLEKAFAFFDGCVDPKMSKAGKEAHDRCVAGFQPSQGEPFTAVGASMAQTLAARGGAARRDTLDTYHARGPAAFFADYIAAYRADSAIPGAYRFSSVFEKEVARWNRDWPRTFTDDTRTTAVTVFEPIDAARLRQTFAGASVYPDLSSELSEVARLNCEQSRKDPALEAANLNAVLYPTSAQAAVYLAGTNLCFGQTAEARALLQKARTLDEGERYTSAGFLNGMAYELAGSGKLDAATQTLRAAIEIHPKAANLYDSLGELEARAGHKDASIAAYRKAVELDPKMQSSVEALKKLEAASP